MASSGSHERASLPIKSGGGKTGYGSTPRDVEESVSIEPRHIVADRLARKLSARQVQMIAMLVNAFFIVLLRTQWLH